MNRWNAEKNGRTVDPDVDQIDRLVQEICRERRNWALLPKWEKIIQAYKIDLPAVKKELEGIRDTYRKLAEPPLRYGIYLGSDREHEKEAVIGVENSRYRAAVADGIGADDQAVLPGREVLVNEKMNVVGLGGMYEAGEIAEVVNVLIPEKGFKVIDIVQKTPDEPMRLRLLSNEEKEILTDCSDELMKQGVHLNDFVFCDPANRQALSRMLPRLHVRSGADDGLVVDMTDQLFRQGVVIGDIVRMNSGLKIAFERLPVYETGELTLKEIPDVTYDDIGGLDDQIERIYDAIQLPYLYRSRFETYQLSRPRGILLYGPPGCGKTMAAKAVANSLTESIKAHLEEIEGLIRFYRRFVQGPADDVLMAEYMQFISERIDGSVSTEAISEETARQQLLDRLKAYDIDPGRLDEELGKIEEVKKRPEGVRSFFLNVKGPELLDKYVGETEHRIRKIFDEARRYAGFYTPVVIFFDEMEAMFRLRGAGRSSDIETTIVPQLLSEIDGIEKTDNLIVIGATNRDDMIDPAILRPGRLDIKIKVDRPSSDSAQDIFALYLSPVIPLNSEHLSLPDTTMEPGEIIFRSAYRHHGLSFVSDRLGLETGKLDQLMPMGCDMRMAQSFTAEDLKSLSSLPLHLSLREADLYKVADQRLWALLNDFHGTQKIGELILPLQQFRTRMDQDSFFAEGVSYFCRREWTAEKMIINIVSFLYHPDGRIRVLTNSGNEYDFPFKDFISGAMIAGVVARSKSKAVKASLKVVDPHQTGVAMNHLFESVCNEFEETKEQLIHDKLHNEMALPDETALSIGLEFPPVELS